MALTFDDGPDPVDTPKLLDLLREKNVKATFFVIGKRADQCPGGGQAGARDGLSDPEIGDFHLSRVTQEQISRLDVAVHHAHAVGVRKRRTGVPADPGGCRRLLAWARQHAPGPQLA